MAFQIGTNLVDARNGFALHLRNLGVNFIEHCVKSGEFSVEQMNLLRVQFWSLLFCETGAFACEGERSLLKEKISCCMAILACKLWLKLEDDPLQWNDFFEAGILESVLKASIGLIDPNEHLRRQEFALLVISEFVHLIRAPLADSALNISEDRRLQLLAGLEIVLPSFTQWLFSNFPLAVAGKVNGLVLNAAVSCFRAICPWMGNNNNNGLDSHGIESFISSCVQILLERADDEELIINILDSFQIYFSTKCFSPSEQRILEFFLTTLQPQLVVLLQKYSSDEDSYQNFKLLTQCFTSIGSRYICNRKSPLILKNINEIIELFIALAQLPSLTVYLDFLDLFSTMFRCELFTQKVSLKGHIEKFFMLLATKMTAVKSVERKSTFNQIDFEDSAEFNEFWKLSRSRTGDFIKLITTHYPDLVLNYSYNALGTFIQSKSSLNTTWEGLLFIEEFVSKGIDASSAPLHHQMLLMHLQLLTLHGTIPEDGVVLNRWISCVKDFTALLGDSCPEDDFKRSIESLFRLTVMEGTKIICDSLKSEAALAILKLADSNPGLFSPLLEPLLTAVSPLLQSPSTAGSWQRKLFSELVLIFMLHPNIPVEKQMQLFSLVADPLAELLKEAKRLLCAGPDPALLLMNHLGFNELTGNQLSPGSLKFSKDLNILLSSLQIVFKRVGPLVKSNFHSQVVQTCIQVLDELVGYLMLMIQCIHRMGTRQLWSAFYNSSDDREYNEFFSKMIEFTDDSNPLLDDSTDSPSSSIPYVHISGWIRHYRQTCYLVLGMAATNFGASFFVLPQIEERLLTQPLSSLEALSLADWNVLIKLFLKPVLAAAPEQSLPILLGASLQGLLSLLAGKLDQEWKLVQQANSNFNSNSSSLVLEMARESKCILLSNGLVNFFTDLFRIPSIDAMKCVNLRFALEQDNLLPALPFEFDGSPAGWLFSPGQEALVWSLIDFAGNAMLSWPRSVGAYVRLVNLQIRLLAAIMSNTHLPNRAEFLSKSVDYAASAWALPSWTDYQQPLMALLTEQYKWSFLMAAAENHSGPMLFVDSDPVSFLKELSFKAFYNQMTVFERIFNEKYRIPQGDLLSLRTPILCSESLKAQRNSLRGLLQKFSISTSTLNAASSSSIDSKQQKELTIRLTEMKKKLNRAPPIEDSENFDSILHDLFNSS